MSHYVETLLYTLKPGEGAAFDRIMRERSVPLHQAAGMDVVAYGNSLHDPDAYVLIRAYDSLEHLERLTRPPGGEPARAFSSPQGAGRSPCSAWASTGDAAEAERNRRIDPARFC